MVSLQATSSRVIEQTSSPRLFFSSEFLDESDFISICPNPEKERRDDERAKAARNADFKFLSGNLTNMMSADELFSEGKLLPFWQMHHAEKLSRIALKSENRADADEGPERKLHMINKDESRISWFLDDDPSPRPPTCTVLWKELLRLKKQRGFSSALSPSSSSSSSKASSSAHDVLSGDEKTERVVITTNNKDKSNNNVKRVKKGNERTRTSSIRIRPVINVPICSHSKNSALSPIFSLRKGRLER